MASTIFATRLGIRACDPYALTEEDDAAGSITEQLSPKTSVRNQNVVRRREAKSADARGIYPWKEFDDLSFSLHLKPMSGS